MKPELNSEYRGPHTRYTFDFPEWGKTIDLVVPFSEEEMELIKQARELRDSLGEQMMASGWQREVYATYDVPWGQALRDRNEVISRLTRLRKFLDSIINFPDVHEDDITQRPGDFARKMSALLDQIPS